MILFSKQKQVWHAQRFPTITQKFEISLSNLSKLRRSMRLLPTTTRSPFSFRTQILNFFFALSCTSGSGDSAFGNHSASDRGDNEFRFSKTCKFEMQTFESIANFQVFENNAFIRQPFLDSRRPCRVEWFGAAAAAPDSNWRLRIADASRIATYFGDFGTAAFILDFAIGEWNGYVENLTFRFQGLNKDDCWTSIWIDLWNRKLKFTQWIGFEHLIYLIFWKFKIGNVVSVCRTD